MDRGGAERQVVLLAQGLKTHQIPVHVVLLTRGGAREEDLKRYGIPYTIIGKRTKFDPTSYWRLKKLIKQLKPNIVHTFIFAANSYGRAAACAAGVPVVIGSERCVDLWKTERHFLIDRFLAKKSAAITTNSQGIVDFYSAHGIAADLFHVIPNAIPEQTPETATREEIANQYRLDPARRWIGAVGRLWPQKRYRDLIWAADMLNNRREGDTTLVILGDGPQRGELLRYRDSVSSPERIVFAGESSAVGKLLPHLDAFWLASEYEGQSNALMEAMQAGVPCIVTDIPGNRDLIIHDETGILVELGDAADFARQTQHLWDHPEFTRKLVNKAQEKIVQEFSCEAMIQAHLSLYHQLLIATTGTR